MASSKPRVVPSAAQAEIIGHREGPSLVLAGAGSGKTSTIALRVASMIDEGIRPSEILGMTFSRKAAGELSERIAGYTDSARARKLTLDTFHAFGFRLLREWPEAFRRARGVTIMDASDQKRLVRDVARAVGIAMSESSQRSAVEKSMRAYSLAKNLGQPAYVAPDQVREMIRWHLEGPAEVELDKLMALCLAYEERMARMNLVDFDDLCLLPALALHRNDEMAHTVRRRYRYCIIDEAQDTCVVQYMVLAALGAEHRNVMMIGDQSQSIYRFRGAMVENLTRFIQDFNPRRYLLQQNYRSIAPVVAAASNMITINGGLACEPFSTEQGQGGVEVERVADGPSVIQLLKRRLSAVLASGTRPEDIAILYRVGSLSRLSETACAALGAPYHVVGGNSMFDSKEGRAAIAGGRLLFNPSDIGALGAIAEFYDLLTDSMLAKVVDQVSRVGGTVWSALRSQGDRGETVAADLERRLESLRQMGPDKAGAWVAHDIGLDMEGHFQRKASRARTRDVEEMEKELERRRETLQMIDLGTAEAIQTLMQDTPEAAPEQLWACLLESRIDDRQEPSAGKGITLSTIHRAKGLEWTVVIVVGMSESILPLLRTGDDDEASEGQGLEEERRLAYVATTRARRLCILVHADRWAPYVRREGCLKPSRFIAEMKLPESRPAAIVSAPPVPVRRLRTIPTIIDF